MKHPDAVDHITHDVALTTSDLNSAFSVKDHFPELKLVKLSDNPIHTYSAVTAIHEPEQIVLERGGWGSMSPHGSYLQDNSSATYTNAHEKDAAPAKNEQRERNSAEAQERESAARRLQAWQYAQLQEVFYPDEDADGVFRAIADDFIAVEDAHEAAEAARRLLEAEQRAEVEKRAAEEIVRQEVEKRAHRAKKQRLDEQAQLKKDRDQRKAQQEASLSKIAQALSSALDGGKENANVQDFKRSTNNNTNPPTPKEPRSSEAKALDSVFKAGRNAAAVHEFKPLGSSSGQIFVPQEPQSENAKIMHGHFTSGKEADTRQVFQPQNKSAPLRPHRTQ